MPKDECIIFGRSPFIETVDVSKLIKNYYTIGLNKFSYHYPVDLNVWFDAFEHHDPNVMQLLPAHLDTKTPLPPHYLQYHHRTADRPTKLQDQDKIICLAFKLFCVSIAYSWAKHHDFKAIYLVGIDHVESVTQFDHYGGEELDVRDEPAELTPSSHQQIKLFLSQGNTYQTNPAVAPDWPMPYYSLEDLYKRH